MMVQNNRIPCLTTENSDMNFMEYRQAALARLKPSQKDLDHGFELHKNAIVCDTYGFAPISPVNPQKLIQSAATGCSPAQFLELKDEMHNLRHLDDSSLYDEYARAWAEAGVTCIFQNAGEETQKIKQLVKRLARMTHIVDSMPDLYHRAVSPRDIEAAKKSGKRCLYLTANAVPLVEEWNSAADELSFIKIFSQLGIRMMHLTYNRRNMIGDGCAEKSNGGLSDFGCSVVAEMNKTGVMVDVAHSGENTSIEAARISAKPIVASHSCVASLNRHYRCKSDKVIKCIADTGGYIGICLIPEFLGDSANINVLLDHIEYVRNKFGADHAAIGTDTPIKLSGYDEALEEIKSVRPKSDRWASLWPATAKKPVAPTEEDRMSLSWINWPMFTVGMVQRGFRDDEIIKILGGNMLRVATEAQSASAYENRAV